MYTMERAHLNIREWVTTCGAKLTARLVATEDNITEAGHAARAFIVAAYNRAKLGHRRLQEALLERERRLSKLLADSPEPMIVTDDAHRVLDANSAGLALLGVSKANLRNFTIDAFLPSTQTHFFERGGPPFVKGIVRLGECEISRLDGKSQVTGFTFHPDVVLGRHVATFQLEVPSSHKR